MKSYRKQKILTLLLIVIVAVLGTLKFGVTLLYVTPDMKTTQLLLFEVCFGSLLLFSSMYFLFLRPLVDEVENRVTLQTKLLEMERNNRAVITALPDKIIRLSSDGTLIDFKTGHWDSLHSVNNMKIEDVLHSDIASKLLEHLKATISTESITHFEVKIPGDDEELLHKECRMAKCDEKSVIAIIRDITEQRSNENKLWYMSTHDALTGLYNRNFFEAETDRISRGRVSPVSVIIIDIDKLKDTNDLLGHDAGDRLICDMARILKKAFRTDDIVARIGGDEFAVVLPNSGSGDVKLAVERVYNCLKKEKEYNKDITLEFSLGYATTDTATTLIKTLKHADKMMYQNKYEKKHSVINLGSQLFSGAA